MAKNAALGLFGIGRYEDAAVLFRAAGMNREGFRYFLESEKFEIAVRFIRNAADEEEKKELLFELGCKLFELNRLEDCVVVFAEVEEFHPVLYVLFSMGLVTDAYFLMRHLRENRKLRKVERKNSSLTEISNLDELCNMIENQFEKTLERLDLKN